MVYPHAGSNPATPHILQHEMPRSKPDRRDVRMPSAGAVFEKRVFFLQSEAGVMPMEDYATLILWGI